MINVLSLKSLGDTDRPDRESRLVKAAVRTSEWVYTGWRHSAIIRHMAEQGHLNAAQDEQGFVCQFGYFYNRYRAARIALRARQIAGIPPMLTSEDLWDDDGTPREVGKPYNPVGDRQAAIDRAAEWRDRFRR